MGNQELIIDCVKRYIKSGNGLNSAIMIKGKWGCGKTYFVKNILPKRLEEQLNKDNKNMCYITLNGLTSVKDIMNRLQSEFFKNHYRLKNKKENKDSSNMDIITGIDSIFDNINLHASLTIIKGIGKKAKSYASEKYLTSTVFIFDDFERCSINKNEVLGTINDLIEHKQCKCIIIANEEEIKNSEDYNKIKEKFISRTLEYIPDVKSFFVEERNKYINEPLHDLDDKFWTDFIKNKVYSSRVNLRTIQSALFITNEVYTICKCDCTVYQENKEVLQYVLQKLLIDIYRIEEHCKEGKHKLESEDNGKLLGVYNLGLNGDYESYFEMFPFIFDIVYDGLYNKENILESIDTFVHNIKTNGKLSPITELKEYYYLEDEEIQEKLNLISSTIDKLNLEQVSTLFNFLIPLLDLGFNYDGITDFYKVLDQVISKSEISELKNDMLLDTIKNHTSLKDEQNKKYRYAMEHMLLSLEEKLAISSQNIDNLLDRVNWVEALREDLKYNEQVYRNDMIYFSYFNLEVLLKKLGDATNKELTEFRNILYSLYRRNNCVNSFCNDVKSIREFIYKLNELEVKGKINKQTIKYIIGDLSTSFPI